MNEKIRTDFDLRKKFGFVKFGDPYESRTRVAAVKGRCLDHLTKGPRMVAAMGVEPMTFRV